MMTVEEIKVALRFHKIKRVAEEVAVDPSTLYTLMKDPHHEPRYKTVKALSDWLTANRTAG